jgi:hypothetical protein
LQNQDVRMQAIGMPNRPAWEAMVRSKAKTMRTPAAPPRAGRRRWEMIAAFGCTTFSDDLVTH